MTTNTPQLVYPSKNFMRSVFDVMKTSVKHEIVVRNGWRMDLLRRSIEIWPKFIGDNDRLGQKGKASFVISSYALFSLFHNHIRAISNNYNMKYQIFDSEIKITYFLPESKNDKGQAV